ncbi:non-ribosomal peptide synthetase, partial [Microbulbifer epialgicus]
MKVDELFELLRQKDIRISIADDNLRVLDPNGNITSTIISQLKSFKIELIDILKSASPFQPSDFPYVNFENEAIDEIQEKNLYLDDVYITTPMQEGMIYHGILDGSAKSYTNQLHASIKGNLDVVAFHTAWKNLIERYSIFRTSFSDSKYKQIHQIVHKSVDLKIRIEDWRESDCKNFEEKLDALHFADRNKGFDFGFPPLIRLTLIRLSDDEWHFLWTHHHIIIDGWSLPIIFRDLIEIYRSLISKDTPELSPVIPYKNYIAWLFSQNHNNAKIFWRDHLANISHPTPLAVNRLSYISDQPDYHVSKLIIPNKLSGQIADYAKRMHRTLNTIVQAAWSYLLYRYSGEDRVVFGATVSGRPTEIEGVEGMVGLFIATVPIPVTFADDWTLDSIYGQLQIGNIERENFCYLGLPEIQKQSDIPPGNQLFDSILLVENYPIEGLLEGLNNQHETDITFESIHCADHTNYPLTVEVRFTEQIELKITFNKEQFLTSSIEQMLKHLKNILIYFTEIKENQHLNRMDILSDDEHENLTDWNNTQADYADKYCIHEVFEQQVQSTPDAIAAVFEHESLTYRELNEQANQLAHLLVKQGAQPDGLIALCVDRSLEMLIGILGILKAGGAYLPIDPTYPEEHIDYILKDSGVVTVVTQSELLSEISFEDLKVIPIDVDMRSALLSGYSKDNLGAQALSLSSTHLAYAIYTSGSTGQPKGVLLTHQAAVNLAQSQQQLFEVESHSRVLQFASQSFDAAVSEWLMALLKGATLYICSHVDRQSPQILERYLVDRKITHVTLPPALLAHISPDKAYALKSLIVAGETCDSSLAHTWSEHWRLFNAYGPTEGTVCASVAKLSPSEPVSIGRPIDNVQLHVLDKRMQLVPIGVIGELHIGGIGVARGYLNRPELTKEKFIPNPFGSDPKDRLYKTGDLVRRLPDGNLEFMGRIDDQVKLRGFRIELGEIESALSEINGIKHSVVQAREDAGREKTLVAYVVLEAAAYAQEQEESARAERQQYIEEYKRTLKARLPAYMVPSVYVFLPELPLTPNGKVDKSALPAPDESDWVKAQYVAPRNDDEARLCVLWSNILKVSEVGVHDDFFALGGHSLLATRLVSQIRQEFEV